MKKHAFLLTIFFLLFFFFKTRRGFKNRNVRHLDLLKSTVLGEGSGFFKSI